MREKTRQEDAASAAQLPLPNGWFMVAFSDSLEAGQVVPLSQFGKELVLFRAGSGHPALLDAYCPHLGAHLGHGGTVAGDSLRCPFHAWEWDGAGRCTRVPYARQIPPRARARSWKVAEHSGRIWAWHAADGSDPFFQVHDMPEETDAAWAPCRRDEYTIRTHLQEMAENQADVAHFHTVHGADMGSLELEAKTEGPHLRLQTHSMRHAPGEAGGHVIESLSSGLGVSSIRFVVDGRPIVAEVYCGTPIDAETVSASVTYRIRADASEVERAMASELVDFTASQFENDVPIWENKVYRPTPILCDGDGLIAEFRRWCQQFYPAAA